MLCQVIRDTDKLDLLYLIGEGSIEENETNEPFSPQVKQDFIHHRSVKRTDVKNGNDFILLHLAFIFDLNYDYSFQYIYEKRLIEKIYNIIKDKERFEPYFKIAQKYIEERVIKNAR